MSVTHLFDSNSGAGGGEDRALPEVDCEEEPDEDWCAQRGLLDPDTCSEVAKHCNETKMAAKTVQVGASDASFLCTIDVWARSLQGRACSDVEVLLGGDLSTVTPSSPPKVLSRLALTPADCPLWVLSSADLQKSCKMPHVPASCARILAADAHVAHGKPAMQRAAAGMNACVRTAGDEHAPLPVHPAGR